MIIENKEFEKYMIAMLKENGLDLSLLNLNEGKENIVSEDILDTTGMVLKLYDEQ